jgi:hypothetical protein
MWGGQDIIRLFCVQREAAIIQLEPVTSSFEPVQGGAAYCYVFRSYY